MEIEVMQYLPLNDLDKPSNLGKVQVLLGKRMFVWMNIVKGKKTAFCRFPSFKQETGGLNLGYHPLFGWVDDKKKERQISDEVIKILKRDYWK